MSMYNGKYCCNCQYWSGARKVSSFKDRSEVKSGGDQGTCLCQKSPNSKGKPRRADQLATCSHFEKWDQLK